MSSSTNTPRRGSDVFAGTSLAIKALREVSDVAQIPILKGLASLAVMVVDTCQVHVYQASIPAHPLRYRVFFSKLKPTRTISTIWHSASLSL